jgi:hypothetical protein
LAFFWPPLKFIDLPNTSAVAVTSSTRTFVGVADDTRVYRYSTDNFNTAFFPSLAPFCEYIGTGTSLDISGDGTKVLGVMAPGTTSCQTAIYSSASGGTTKLSDLLTTAGVSIGTGYRLDSGSGISRNGKVVIGCGTLNGDTVYEHWIGYRAVLP